MPRAPESMKAGDILVRAGCLTAEQHEAAVLHARRGKGRIEDVIVDLGFLREADLLKALAAHYKTRFVTSSRLAKADVTRAALAMIPRRTAESLLVFPVLFDAATQVLSVVSVDPDDVELLREVRVASGARELKAFLARPAAVRAAIAKSYGGDLHAFDALDREAHVQRHGVVDTYERVLLSEDTMPSGSRAEGTTAPLHERIVSERHLKAAVLLPPTSPGVTSAASITTAPTESVVEILSVLVTLLENDRQELRGHSAQVARLVRRVGERMKLPAEQVTAAVIAAFVHDLGKHGKNHGKQPSYHLTSLNCNEWESHRLAGRKAATTPARLLEATKLPPAALDAVLHMYERWDGAGFPDGLVGKEIPLGARILAICDTYADLTENPKNPYRKGLSAVNACTVLAQRKEKIFDPHLTDLLASLVLGEGVRAKILSRYVALVVDADPEETTVLELRLAEQGFEVKTARSAEEALKVLAGGDVDLVVSELELPQKDGLALLADARKETWGKDLAWVVHTGRQAKAEAQKAFALGALDFVGKGGSAEVLVAKLKALLDQRATSNLKSARGVSGSLAEMALPELVQVLAQSRKSGNLAVRRAGDAGEIHFQEGEVVDATWQPASGAGALRGAPAFYAILALKDGDFAMDPTFKPRTRVIHESAETLLLEGMRRLDEA